MSSMRRTIRRAAARKAKKGIITAKEKAMNRRERRENRRKRNESKD